MSKIELNGKSFVEIISEQEIKGILDSLAVKINKDFQGRNPIIITVLDGAFIFAADLVRKFTFEHEFCFVKLSSYEGMESKREVSEVWSSPRNATNRDILIIEDIVDTGLTMNFYIERLMKEDVKSISICSLLVKPERLEVSSFELKYVGKSISDDFVVGYGLDWDQRGRHYPSIYQLENS